MRADVSDEKALLALVKKCSPDVIVNSVKPPLSTDQMEAERALAYSLNTHLPARLASWQEEMGFSLLHISTDWVYEGKEGAEYCEDDLAYPKNYYSYTKAVAEEKILACNGKPLILRTEGVFGFDEKGSNILLRLKNSKKAGMAVFAPSGQFSQPISGEELAGLASILLQKKKSGIFNAVGREYLSRHEFAKKADGFFSFGAKIEDYPLEGRKIQIPAHLRLSIEKIEKAAGKVRSLDEQFRSLKQTGVFDGQGRD